MKKVSFCPISLSHLKAYFLLSFFFLFSVSSSFAQFITPVSGATILTTNQITLKTKFQVLSTTQSLQVIQLGNPLTLQNQGILSLQVPGVSTVQRFKAKYVRIETNGDFTWIGDRVPRYLPDSITLDSGAYATILLMKKSGNMFGEMQIDSLSYQIKDLGQGLNALILMKDPTTDKEKFCGTTDGTDTIKDTQEGDFPETLCPVKAVVLYTQAALNAHPDMAQIIELAIAETNQAFLNSNISEATLKIVLAGTHLLTPSEWVESANSTDKDDIAIDSDIQAYRAFYHADLVYVMTNDIHTEFTGAVNSFGDGPGNVVNAYAIVEAGSATTPTFTFAHETGHLFGTRHDRHEIADHSCGGRGDNSGLPFAHAFLFDIGKLWWKKFFATIMTVCHDNAQRVTLQSFSNPNVKFNGKATGSDDKQFNAKVVAFASCRVSHYVEDDPIVLPPSVALTNSFDRICPGQPFTVKAVIMNVSGTITYSWSTSLDGVTYSYPITNTSNIFTVNAPL